MAINVKFPDGSIKTFDQPVTALQVAESISGGLARNAVCCQINGENRDIANLITTDVDFKIFTAKDAEGLEVLRHSAAHLLAQAVKRLYPNAKLAIGPAVKNGFYYDIDFGCEVTPDDLPKIEAEMAKIVKEDCKIVREEVSLQDAIAMFEASGDIYKVEILKELPEGNVSLYRQGEFVDLCRGPHIPSTGKIKAFKLTSIAGAYWRGDTKNKMLTRIYGTAFDKKAELDEYLLRIEEAKKRDHRKLGRELDLFDILDEGPGFPFFFPKGMVLRNNLEDFWRQEHAKRGYTEVKTPIILKSSDYIL